MRTVLTYHTRRAFGEGVVLILHLDCGCFVDFVKPEPVPKECECPLGHTAPNA